MLKRKLNNQKGLTLVELLAVIVVLGIIAAIAIPAIGGVIDKSKRNADEATLTLIKDAAIRYAMTENIDSVTRANGNIQSLLIGNGYLNNFSATLQSNSARAFDSFELSFDSTNKRYEVKVYDAAPDPQEITFPSSN